MPYVRCPGGCGERGRLVRYNRRTMAERLAAARRAAAAQTDAGFKRYAEAGAGFGPRLLAYLIDSTLLFAFLMLFFVLAGLVIFVDSGFGERDASDAAFDAFSVVLVVSLPVWFLAMLALLARRGQSLGQYFMGLRVVREDGARLDAGGAARYLLALHPLLFHPFLGGVCGFIALQGVISVREALFALGAAAAVLCIVAPLVTWLYALADPDRRPLHDRVAGASVIRAAE